MVAYEYSSERRAFTKFCSGCQNDFIAASTEEESRIIFAKFFGIHNKQDGFQSHCKDCMRTNRRLRKGIDQHNEREMFEKQNGKCAICCVQLHQPYRFNGDPQGARVDHDHVTGKVRGLLCHTCNTLIGFYEVLLQRAPDFDFDTVDKYIRGQ